jgi:hypothetical protein
MGNTNLSPVINGLKSYPLRQINRTSLNSFRDHLWCRQWGEHNAVLHRHKNHNEKPIGSFVTSIAVNPCPIWTGWVDWPDQTQYPALLMVPCTSLCIAPCIVSKISLKILYFLLACIYFSISICTSQMYGFVCTK